ncbi:RNA polymerase sigma factor [Algoriphagus namhaensis]|uniref:RNA polymerase sigma factor n=1 Tax=Algoriphagus namhaensis TaxID=915353 RepID=A0ABV8AUS5_9BACT
MTKFGDQEILNLINHPSTREKGFRQLIVTHQERVYHLIRRMVIIHEDADDLTQNTFIKAFKYIHKFEGQSSLFTWLYRIATNEALSFLEKKKKRFFLPIDDYNETLANYLDHGIQFTGDEIQQKLQKALLTLPDKQRLVFHLKYQEDLSYQEISEITKTSVGSLKASYHHAVKKIEQYLGED